MGEKNMCCLNDMAVRDKDLATVPGDPELPRGKDILSLIISPLRILRPSPTHTHLS